MGMRDEIQADLKQAFDTDLADAVKAFTGSRTVDLSYDPVTDTQLTDVESYTGRGVFGNFSKSEIDNLNILITDVRLLCLQSDVTDAPQNDDVINGMRLIKVGKDPADVTWVLQLRGT